MDTVISHYAYWPTESHVGILLNAYWVAAAALTVDATHSIMILDLISGLADRKPSFYLG